MNSFHELNTMTSRGDIKGAFALIRDWPENIARKIMKKAGYSVPSHTGRAFWLWVQQTLTQSARERRGGYEENLRHDRTVPDYRRQSQDDYLMYTQIMSGSVRDDSTTPERNNSVEAPEPENIMPPVSAPARMEDNDANEDNDMCEALNNLPDPEVPDISDCLCSEKTEKISQAILRRNVFILYSTPVLLIILVSISQLFTLPAGTAVKNAVASLAVYFALLLGGVFLFHVLAERTTRSGKPYSTGRADHFLIKKFSPRAYRPGRYIGIRLTADLKPAQSAKWIHALAEYVVKERCSRADPLIIRSHLLCLPRWRNRLVRELTAAGMSCHIRTNLPLLFPRKLTWLTAAVLALRGHIPPIYGREAEIVVTPGPD
ncbi:hypothetical protein [Pantoea cypripedii]|uniref:Uncharacterized protein n=1 Tax=Pantoea cypripedii TaxID=55209 RepID=A0A1X1EMR1_PANCY|nr:hypothetical protein [Pantoea cypripedii]MBP2200522.1 hypothetical protein [Pantoea cypripedii]ORM90102.1 hypothetical protein HA50_26390 [Pantoea cypripedii]